MKFFILEDNSERIRWFKSVLKKDSILFFADNVNDAKRTLLEEKDFDMLFLDHDLDQRVYVDSDENNTGYQLTKFIVENKISFKSAIIHSMNQYGARLMYETLSEISDSVDMIDFSTLRRNILYLFDILN